MLVVLRWLDPLIALVGHNGLRDRQTRMLCVEVEVTDTQPRQQTQARAAQLRDSRPSNDHHRPGPERDAPRL